MDTLPDLRTQTQHLIALRKSQPAAAAAATLVNFTHWWFFPGPDFLSIQVTATPVSSGIALTYATINLEASDGTLITSAAVNTAASPTNGSFIIYAASAVPGIAPHGAVVNAWAAVTTEEQSQVSPTMTYTVP